jgi:hypothetical protein
MALSTPLRDDPAYMADLDEEILSTRHAWISSAVLEIARFREEIAGPQHG